ncbi:MAG: hypothetical protein JXJ17_01235 [Anaerolineae bacterium]|nr:hypothetical protein [Anaerolineae bacterium]
MSERYRRVSNFIERLPAPLRVIARGFADWFEEFLIMLGMNLIVVLSMATIVLGPPALIGMYAAASKVAEGRVIKLRDMYDGARQHFGRAWILAALNLLMIGLTLFNVYYYSQIETTWAVAARSVMVSISILWIIVQFYVPAYLVSLEEPKVKEAFRLSSLTVSASLIYTIVVAGLFSFLLFFLLLKWPFTILFFPSLMALVSCHAVRERQAYYRKRQEEQKKKEKEDEEKKDPRRFNNDWRS